MKYERDWKEDWIDRMGLIVALSGEERFEALRKFKADMNWKLRPHEQIELKETLRMRFTPTNGKEGCQSATAAVKEATA